MIQTKHELIQLLNPIYNHFQLPLFLLSKELLIMESPDSFFKLENHYFQEMIQENHINDYKTYMHFYHNASFLFFPYALENISYICIGPIFNKKLTPQDKPSEYSFLNHVISQYTINDFLNLPYVHHKTVDFLLFVYQIITGEVLDANVLKKNYKQSSSLPLKQEESMQNEIFVIRENPLHDFSYSYEKKIMNSIQQENSTQARILMNELMQIKDGRELAPNHLVSMKYKLVAAVTLFTRCVIDVGVPIAKAYTLSDVYINKLDQCHTGQELHKMISDAIVDFTNLVKRYKHIQNPYWVKSCKNYISQHLHMTITLNDLSELTGMNPSYLSTQFKKVTGQSIKQYVNEKKIQEAQFLIKNSSYTLAEISDILQFSSQSHFNKVFKNQTGKSPTQYKNT
ncbi:helix-turn-helix domain-containing protein [Candidatus Stoquefichus massiliensis]|uniref:helix-turn-helix domain-containing protein n=1 Tax=Candidatus Stoquefichus massiliensis TaxID=1470350 RepID=UPI000484F443|nr:AraC family transcriptional regulator [Candidatus Stoquefichus massiliensis]